MLVVVTVDLGGTVVVMVVVGESCGGGGIVMSVVMGLVVSMSDKRGPEK